MADADLAFHLPVERDPPQPSDGPDVRPMRTLWLLSAAHAVNHAQAALLPLVYLAIIPEFGITAAAIALLAAAGNIASGVIQLAYAGLTRMFTRRAILTTGGLVFGGGMVALKSIVWRPLGHIRRIRSTSSMKPRSSISSASSRTT